MKAAKKIIISFLILAILISSLLVVVFGATEVESGSTVTVLFTVNSVYGLDGYFEFSNKSLFKSISYKNNSKLAGDIANDRVFLYGSNEANVTIAVTLTTVRNAAVGSQCEIKFTYETSDANGTMSAWKTQSKTIKIKAKPVETKPPETEPPETDPPETEPPETEPPETEPPIVIEIDYTELKRQISIATSLDEYEYTAESWDAMVPVLLHAQELLESKSQEEVDAGAKALEEAIDALVKIDFTELRKAINMALSLDDNIAHGNLWYELFDLITSADSVMKSRNQAAVDELARKINDLIEKLLKDCENSGIQTVEIIKEVTVEVPVEPNDEYCNIKIHKIWPILFFIALGILLIMTALILLFFTKKKKNEKDETPIVDYDIADDANG